MNEYINRSKAEREAALHTEAEFDNDQTNNNKSEH